jgi:hypothetical protein
VVFDRLFIVVVVPALNLFVQVFRRPWLFWVIVMEFLKLLRTAYEIPGRVPGRIRVVAFPADQVAQGPSYDLAC